MTHLELRDSLLTRIGWRQHHSITVDANNLQSDSGRVFQDEHPTVSIDNIQAVIDKINATETEINTELSKIKNQAILLVLSDVFEVANVDDNVIENRENIFDNAISKRAAIIVAEMILTTKRSNISEAITKEYQQRLFLELNGNEGNNDFPTYLGIRARYGQEIKKVKDLLNQVDALDRYTLR